MKKAKADNSLRRLHRGLDAQPWKDDRRSGCNNIISHNVLSVYSLLKNLPTTVSIASLTYYR